MTAPIVPSAAPIAGLLFQVTVVSAQVAVTAKNRPPTGLASVTKRRKRAAVMVPVMPETAKRM